MITVVTMLEEHLQLRQNSFAGAGNPVEIGIGKEG